MAFVKTQDGTQLFYSTWGKNENANAVSGSGAVVFVSSQAMTSSLWAYNLPAVAAQRLRCVSFDRRGHGRSDRPCDGYDLDTLADDLAAVIERLELRDVTLVGHSLGGSEIVRYLARHGEARVRRAVLIAPIAPLLVKTDDHPEGIDRTMIEATRATWQVDLPRWVRDNARAFFEPDTSEAMVSWGERELLEIDLNVLLACSVSGAYTDLRPDLRKIGTPTLVIHGDRDQSVPVHLGRMTAGLLRKGQFALHEGAGHGVLITRAARVNRQILDFIGR